MECDDCRLQFALPLESDSAVYEAIYRRPALVPGYDRYYDYARSAKRSPNPLDYLAESMEPYWAVRKAIAGLPSGAKMLDIGSGLGYVAYALRRAGYDAVGLDISENAVAAARARFGDQYVVADLFAWSSDHPNTYDAVTLLEVIEHVENPIDWVRAAFRLVRPGGMLIISTPNRDYYPDGSVWATEAPPVHLWWFSEHSFARLTDGIGAQIEVVDFSACDFAPAQPYSDRPVASFRTPMLNEEGRPSSRLRRAAAALGVLPVAKAVWTLFHGPKNDGRAHPNPAVRETLAVILRKPISG